jgi:nucleotide sugar dehydrogenase
MPLLELIKNKKAVVGVIGLGYVGLPLAVEKAKAGFRVLGFDIQEHKVDKVNRGENYIGDVVSDELEELVKKGRLSATSDFSCLAECDVVAICVPTPLDVFKQPDLSYVKETAASIAQYLKRDMLVILESTTYPGTTEEVIKPILEKSGLKVGADFYLAFSPERVDPGNKIYKTKNTPKVVGGCTPACTEHAKALYEAILDAPVFTVSSPKEAEMSKILENTFRIVNCALANEIAIICNKMGINVWEVIEAASTKPFGFVPFYPGPGVGGHCIPIDPFYLTYRARATDYHTRFIELAGEINDGMPEYVVGRLMDILNEKEKPLKNSHILLVGVAYKGDIDDLRESPALKIWDILEKKGAKVSYHDPYCPEVKRCGRSFYSERLTADLVKSCDAVLITTGHRNKVDYQLIVDNAPVVFDTKNIISKVLDVSIDKYGNIQLL